MDEDDVVHLDEGGQEDHLRGQPAGQVDGGDDDEWVGNDSGMTLLDFERDTLTSTLPDSVLFVVANGLGIERLFLEHLVLFSDRRLLAIVLNTTPHDENYLIGKMKEMNLGCEPKIINADVNTKDREAVYLEGGVQFCSTRVVLVDLLQSRLPVGRVAAILVYRAHNVLTSFQESFVLRLYREKKADGLVKAFTDVPSSLSSIGQLQRLVNRLYVKHVKLIPRFSFDVEHELSQCQLRSAVFSVDVSQSMRRVHRTLLDLIKVCVRDLRACSTTGKQAPNEPVEEISQVPYNVTFLERKLKERRSFMTDKQVRLVADSALLRELLQMAESLDAATVLNKLLVLKSDRQMIEESSGWLMSPTAGRMVEDLQTLCGGSGGFAKFITPPKWDVLVDVLNEVKQIPVDEKELPEHGPSVLVMANAEDVCRQLLDVVRHGLQKAKWMCWRQLGRPCDSPTPPDEPLWPPEHVSLFTRSQLGMRPDARSEMVANVQKAQKAVARATQKKRKAAENLIGRFNSKIQTTIVQFGILHYKRRKTQLASSEVEVKEEAPDEDEQVPTTSAAAHATVKTIGEYDNVELVVMPQGERYSTMKFLEQRKPTVIILYTMSLLSMRQIEIYRACHPNLHLQVYCMQYRDSTEEGRYLESMNRETIAFESLIREQGTLLIPRQFDVQREDAPRIKPSTRDGGGQAAATSSTVDDADATPADVERPKVIVDMREFNSELPTVLYTKGFDVVAATLEARFH